MAFLGNVANNFYGVARALRAQSGIDAHLFLDSRSRQYVNTMPESDTPDLAGGYPDWIHHRPYLGPKSFMFPWTSPLVHELALFDLLIVSGLGPIFAPFIGRPFCFVPSGGDLTVTPFPVDSAHIYSSQGPKEKASAFILALWQRRGIRQAEEVWMLPFDPFIRSLSRLRIPESKVVPGVFRVPIDTLAYSLDSTFSPANDGQIRLIRDRFRFVVFHPSRLMMRTDRIFARAGQSKGNDVFIRGFALFRERRPNIKPALVLPDRTESRDVVLAKRLVQELEIESSVVWIKPPRAESFTRHELRDFYSIADVVGEQFTSAGWFGAVSVEALSMHLPVINALDETVLSALYPWHPMLSGRTPDEVATHLVALSDSPDYRIEKGNQGRRWIEEYHSFEAVAEACAERIAKLA